MLPFLVAVVIAAALVGAIVWSGAHIAGALRADAAAASRGRELDIVGLFAPGLAAAQNDPKALLIWQPIAVAVRRLFPAECAALDTAAGGTFPFSGDVIQAAHSRWTADWLAWERTHDGEYKLKAAAAEADIPHGGVVARARLDAVEREKLELYQRRYEEYVRVARALQGLTKVPS